MKPILRLTLVSAVAALGLALAACGNPAAPQGNYGTIAGIVKSAAGQPVAGATVTVDSVLNGTTGSDGKYTIQTVPVDSSTTTTSVSCHATGYQDPPPQHVTVTSGKQVEVDFTLTPG
jgi:hypothetical protein